MSLCDSTRHNKTTRSLIYEGPGCFVVQKMEAMGLEPMTSRV